jgi:Ca-activated chloride channel homolog
MKTSRQDGAWVFALPLLLLTVFARGAEPQAAPPYRISVNVDLVLLHATVRDLKGRLVPDLREPDFQVYEDGVRQSIRLFRHEDIPVTVGLVVDHSGSMGRKLADAIAAAGTFVRSSNPEDRMFIVNFNEKVTLGLRGPIRFSHRVDELESPILRAPASARNLSSVPKMAEQSSALVNTIGIFDEDDPDRNPDVLRQLSRATGGEACFPGQTHEVVEICERIARDIRGQYTIGYISGNVVKPGVYRSIRVAAAASKSGKLLVRARSGYIASESGPAKSEAAG